jgi:hypothetical protein
MRDRVAQDVGFWAGEDTASLPVPDAAAPLRPEDPWCGAGPRLRAAVILYAAAQFGVPRLQPGRCLGLARGGQIVVGSDALALV